MFRNTGNLGIPLMVLAFGEQQLGAIIILFVLSNLLHFSVGMFILSANTSRWLWLKSPVLWAALAGLLVANLHIPLPEYLVTSASARPDIGAADAVALGIRLMEGLDHLGLALKCNLLYLLAGGISLGLAVWLLPLQPAWVPLLMLSVALPRRCSTTCCASSTSASQRRWPASCSAAMRSVLVIPLAVWLALHLGS